MNSRTARFTFAATLVCFLASSPRALWAQTPPAPPPPAPPTQPAPEAPKEKLPEAREVINRHVKAIGGEEVFRNKKSIRTKCKLSVPVQQMSGDLEVLTAPPNKLVVKSVLPFGTTTAGFNGTTGWIMEPQGGARLADPKQLVELREKSDFLSVLHDDKHFKTITNEAITDFDGRKCYQIKLVRHDDRESTEYYDVATGLLAGRYAKVDGPMGPMEQTVVETEYKKFGDRLFATKMIQKIMGNEIITTVENVEFDTVEPSAFDLPPEVKALLDKPAEEKK
jgi:hypothetical protein